jgi:hypothetical protein
MSTSCSVLVAIFKEVLPDIGLTMYPKSCNMKSRLAKLVRVRWTYAFVKDESKYKIGIIVLTSTQQAIPIRWSAAVHGVLLYYVQANSMTIISELR